MFFQFFFINFFVLFKSIALYYEKKLINLYEFQWIYLLSSYISFSIFLTFEIFIYCFKIKYSLLPKMNQWIIGFFDSLSIVFFTKSLENFSLDFCQMIQLSIYPLFLIILSIIQKKAIQKKMIFSIILIFCGIFLYYFFEKNYQFNYLLYIIFNIISLILSQFLIKYYSEKFSIEEVYISIQGNFPKSIFLFIFSLTFEFFGSNSILKNSLTKEQNYRAIKSSLFVLLSEISFFFLKMKVSDLTLQFIDVFLSFIIIIVIPQVFISSIHNNLLKLVSSFFSIIGLLIFSIYQMEYKLNVNNFEFDDNQIGADLQEHVAEEQTAKPQN